MRGCSCSLLFCLLVYLACVLLGVVFNVFRWFRCSGVGRALRNKRRRSAAHASLNILAGMVLWCCLFPLTLLLLPVLVLSFPLVLNLRFTSFCSVFSLCCSCVLCSPCLDIVQLRPLFLRPSFVSSFSSSFCSCCIFFSVLSLIVLRLLSLFVALVASASFLFCFCLCVPVVFPTLLCLRAMLLQYF